jgi:serine/threonine protein kinase
MWRTLVRNTWRSISRKESKMSEFDHDMSAHSNEPAVVRTKVFISYARKDARFMEEFRRMLQPAIGDKIELWTDKNIEPGEDWNSKIEKAMKSSSIALLLVSDHFLDSSYIMKVELQSILEMQVSNGLKIHWVPLTRAFTERTQLNDLQASWDTNEPLAELSKPDRTRAIKAICQKLLKDAGQLGRLSVDRRKRLTNEVEEAIRRWNIKLDLPIGSGDFAVIYQGFMDGKKVVVKALVDSPIRGSLKGFAEEVERAKGLQHPCFGRLEHAALENEPQCLILEYIESHTVAQHIKQVGEPFSLDDVIILIRRLAQALREYHEKKLLYGIMAAEDVFYDKGRSLLRLSGVSISSRLSVGSLIGGDFPRDQCAATHLVPEQYIGEPYTEKSDQYSLALLAVEMLLGRAPVAVRCAADLQKKSRFFDKPEQFISDLSSRHPGLASVLLRMLQKEPAARYESMNSVAAALKRLEPTDRIRAKQSYLKHCMGKNDFYRKFYERFFQGPEGIRAKEMFADKDLNQQYVKLDQSLHYLLNYGDQHMMEPTVLTTTATIHQTKGVAPEQLERFMECLIETLSNDYQVSGIEVEAWKNVCGPGVEYLKDKLSPATAGDLGVMG